MADINLSSIMSKVNKFTKTNDGQKMMRDKIAEYASDGVGYTAAGEKLTTSEDIYEMSMELIADLQNAAAQACAIGRMPQSVADHFNSLDIVSYTDHYDKKTGKTTYVVKINFLEDMSRPSLLKLSARAEGGSYGRYDTRARTGDGIDNIVALFEFGYMTDKRVFGYWESHGITVRNLLMRTGWYTITYALEDFKKRYPFVEEAELSWSPEDWD